MASVVARRRTVQPQFGAGFSRAALDKFGVCGGFIAGQGLNNPVNIITGAAQTPSAGTLGENAGWKQRPAHFGMAASFFADGAGRAVYHNTGAPSAQAFTFMCRVRLNTAPTSPGVVARTLDNNTIILWRRDSGEFDFRVNSADLTETGTWTLGQWYDIEVVGSASNCTASVDGVQIAAYGSGVGATAIDATMRNGSVDGGGMLVGDVDFQYFIWCKRPLSAIERADFRANPNQLFNSRRAFVPYVASGVTVPTLTAYADQVTATSARPYVQVAW